MSTSSSSSSSFVPSDTEAEIRYLLVSSIDPARVSMAQMRLAELEASLPSFACQLLRVLLTGSSTSLDLDMSTVILFKNAVKKKWQTLGEDERNYIKTNILVVLGKFVPQVSDLVGEAIETIGGTEFPNKWPTVTLGIPTNLTAWIAEMKHGKSRDDDDEPIIGLRSILFALNSLLRRYRLDTRADHNLQTWMAELKPILMVACFTLASRFEGNTPSLLVYDCWGQLAEIVTTLMRCAPEENHSHIKELETWINVNMSMLATRESGSGIVQGAHKRELSAKERVVDMLGYLVRIRGDSPATRPTFLRLFDLCATLLIHSESEFDGLGTAAVQTMSDILAVSDLRVDIGESQIKELVRIVTQSRMCLRPQDRDEFETDCSEFVQKEMDPTEASNSRRGSAMVLLRDLYVHYPEFVLPLLKQSIGELMGVVGDNLWCARDAAFFIIVAMKGEETFVDIGPFMMAYILPCLSGPSSSTLSSSSSTSSSSSSSSSSSFSGADSTGTLILRASAIRFLIEFSDQPVMSGSTNQQALLSALVSDLTSENEIIRRYAARAAKRILHGFAVVCSPHSTRGHGEYKEMGGDGVSPQLSQSLWKALHLAVVNDVDNLDAAKATTYFLLTQSVDRRYNQFAREAMSFVMSTLTKRRPHDDEEEEEETSTTGGLNADRTHWLFEMLTASILGFSQDMIMELVFPAVLPAMWTYLSSDPEHTSSHATQFIALCIALAPDPASSASVPTAGGGGGGVAPLLDALLLTGSAYTPSKIIATLFAIGHVSQRAPHVILAGMNTNKFFYILHQQLKRSPSTPLEDDNAMHLFRHLVRAVLSGKAGEREGFVPVVEMWKSHVMTPFRAVLEKMSSPPNHIIRNHVGVLILEIMTWCPSLELFQVIMEAIAPGFGTSGLNDITLPLLSILYAPRILKRVEVSARQLIGRSEVQACGLASTLTAAMDAIAKRRKNTIGLGSKGNVPPLESRELEAVASQELVSSGMNTDVLFPYVFGDRV